MRTKILVSTLLLTALVGCSSTPPVSQDVHAKAFDLGAHHAALANCSELLRPAELDFHYQATRLRLESLQGAIDSKMESAFISGIEQGASFGKGYRISCSTATAVLRQEAAEYLEQWRAHKKFRGG